MPLEPGAYKLINAETGAALDLSKDRRTVTTQTSHNRINQKWEFTSLGAGFSIRSMFGGLYLTVDGGIEQGVAVIGSIYPACWALEPDDFDGHIWRITWPNAPFLIGIADHDNEELETTVQLSDRYPFEPSCLWRLEKCPSSAPESRSSLHSDVVVNVAKAGKDFELGGSGTVTTTTKTTTVTNIVKHDIHSLEDLQDPNSAFITIKVVYLAETQKKPKETYCKIKRNAKFRKFHDAFANRVGKDVGSLRFLYDGRRTDGSQTPAYFDMKDGDIIDVFNEQIG